MTTLIVFNAHELCQSIHISEHCLIEIVSHGIVTPEGNALTNWTFDAHAFTLIKKAIRLQHDLEMDWAATALAIQLLEQIEQLTAEKDYLTQRLMRLEALQINNL